MKETLEKYQKKRNFRKTLEPIGKVQKSRKRCVFVIQHHWARKEHYDLRLEWNGVLKSFAVPKGLSFSTHEKRLAILVEDHPIAYRNFEGVIPKGEYGGGTVMIYDEGYWEPVSKEVDFSSNELKFILFGRRYKGMWTLVPFKENYWLLIKEKDEFANMKTPRFLFSVRTGRTKEEISEKLETSYSKGIVEGISISNPDKKVFSHPNVTKLDLVKYYQKVFLRMFPYLENRLVSTVRCPDGVPFYKKHFESTHKGMKKVLLRKDSEKRRDYYYIRNIEGVISEVQMNGYEFHLWGSRVKRMNHPDIMVFDLDPDEGLSLQKVRDGVRDLKSILDQLGLVSFLKTSGGKGYHVVVPFTSFSSWKSFTDFSYKVAKLMESKWPLKYTTQMSKKMRKGKIFVDWMRNKKGSTSVAPYSVRLKKKASVSMPISWRELDKVKPDGIGISEALERLKRRDPWEMFFFIHQ